MLGAWVRDPLRSKDAKATTRALYAEASTLPDMPHAVAQLFQSLAAASAVAEVESSPTVPPVPAPPPDEERAVDRLPAPPEDGPPREAREVVQTPPPPPPEPVEPMPFPEGFPPPEAPPPPESIEVPVSPLPPPPEPSDEERDALEATWADLAAEEERLVAWNAEQQMEVEWRRGLMESQVEELRRRESEIELREARFREEENRRAESREDEHASLEVVRRDLAAEKERLAAWIAGQQEEIDRGRGLMQSQLEGLRRREADLAEKEARVRGGDSRKEEQASLEAMRRDLAMERERLAAWMAEQQAAVDRRHGTVQSQLEELRRRESEIELREARIREEENRRAESREDEHASLEVVRRDLEAERARLVIWMEEQRAEVDRRRGMVRSQLEELERREAGMVERERRMRDEENRQRERSTELRRQEEEARQAEAKRALYLVLFSLEGVSQTAARAISDAFVTDARLRTASLQQIGAVAGVLPEEAVLVRDAFSEGAPQRRDLREKAEDLLEEERFEEALEVFDAVVRENPRDIEAWFNRSEVLRLLGRADEASASLDRILEIDPKHKATIRELANHLFERGQFGLAAAHLSDLLKQDPNEADHWLRRAAELLAEGKATEATLIYNAILEGDPKNLLASLALGDLLLAMDDVERADRVYSRVLQHHPDSPQALLKKGLLLNRQGRWGAAIQLFNRAISLRFDYREAWAAKGQVLLTQGKGKEAVEAFDKLVSFDETQCDAWIGKARAHVAAGEADKAAEAAGRALALSKGNADAKEILSRIRQTAQTPPSGQESPRAMPPKTIDGGVLLEIADSLLEKGDAQAALKGYEEVLAENAKDAKALFGKGRALHGLGRYREALRTFADAVKAAPTVEEYTRWLRMCEDRVPKEGGV